MSRCDFGGMIILPAKITSLQFDLMLTICQLNSLTGDYTFVHCENVWLLGLINCEYLAADCKAFSLARKEHQ
jgi:hypothetical protein